MALGLVACIAASHSGPPSTLEPTAAAPPAYVPQLRSIRGTIHEVGPSAGCGFAIWSTLVRHDDISVIVPCIELVEANGPRFAIGETHELLVDECDEVHAIVWRGTRYPLRGMPTVIAPASLASFTMAVHVDTGTISYRAPGWHWPAPRRIDAATAGTACAARR